MSPEKTTEVYGSDVRKETTVKGADRKVEYYTRSRSWGMATGPRISLTGVWRK